MNIILSYDLHSTSSSVYGDVREDIKKTYPTSLRILTTTYLIKTNDSVNTIQRQIKGIMNHHLNSENDYEFFFAEFTRNRSGWLVESKWDWIKTHLDAIASRW